jgi:SHR-binding domain of vacuolar-sorting associated protein 13
LIFNCLRQNIITSILTVTCNARYAQVVRFMPRFTVVNKLDVGVKIMQPTGFGRESVTLHLSPQHLCLYHLPDVYADRKVSLQPEGSWAKSVAFNLDEIGALTLSVKRKQHLASLSHVVTRSAPEYSVSFPPQEIGLYLETDFFDKRYCFCFVYECILLICLVCVCLFICYLFIYCLIVFFNSFIDF